MSEPGRVAIVDYGLGNVFSIQRACEQANIQAILTSDKKEILSSSGVILPGVGAYGNAMATLKRLDLVSVLRDVAQNGTPLMGICLGMQLLLTESLEFGRHEGLGIIPGDVVPMQVTQEGPWAHKVPQVGWNRIWKPVHDEKPDSSSFKDTTRLTGIKNGDFMYFVHSYHCRPANAALIVSVTHYGGLTLCSSFQRENIFATQFHPERSGPSGLRIYHNFKLHITQKKVSTPCP